MARAWRPVAGLVIVAAVVGLWLLPSAFPNPGTNDALGLADAELPLILLIAAGEVVALAVFRGGGGAIIRAALGVFLVGAAAGLVLGLAVFGNLSNDRFGPLLLFPPVFAVLGLVSLVVGVVMSGAHRRELVLGAAYGIVAAAGFGAWTLSRGARDWLLTPYGFDIVALILVLGAALVVFGAGPSLGRRG